VVAATITVSLVRWIVHNSIGGSGLPIEAWGEAARDRLMADTSVESVDVTTTRDDDGIDGFEVAELGITATIEAADGDAAEARVNEAVSAALHDVIGDRPAGWTSSCHTSPAHDR
jgi:hypothetical protein